MTVAALAAEVGFDLPDDYNAARLLWDNLSRNPDAPAILHESGTWSYRELTAEAARIGNHLRDMCAPGDRVLLFMDDEPAYPAAIMGAMRAGLVPMLINTLSPEDLIAFFLEDSDATAVIISEAFAAQFDGVTCPVLNAAKRPWHAASDQLDEHPTTRRDMAFWMYSSGSTGRPKGVVHKHEDAAYTTRTYADHVLHLGSEDICFSIPKIFFAYGFGNSVSFPMSVGAAAVLLSGRPTPGACFELIDRFRPTVLFGLPTLYTALAQDPGIDSVDMSSVRLFVSAAEILSEELAAGWRDRFGKPIVEGLGSTEMLHIYLSNDRNMQKPGSAGCVVPGYAVRLLTPEGKIAAMGTEGVMQVAGLSGAEYYWNRPDKTADTIQDGWLNTGDRFICDDDGFYFYKGRADDLVKVSGQWVYPLEIELALNEHPDVIEACVQAVPLPDKRLTLKAWVAPRCTPDADLTKALQNHAKAALLPHKYPREIIYLETLPKTGTDKIDRQALLTREDETGDPL